MQGFYRLLVTVVGFALLITGPCGKSEKVDVLTPGPSSQPYEMGLTATSPEDPRSDDEWAYRDSRIPADWLHGPFGNELATEDERIDDGFASMDWLNEPLYEGPYPEDEWVYQDIPWGIRIEHLLAVEIDRRQLMLQMLPSHSLTNYLSGIDDFSWLTTVPGISMRIPGLNPEAVLTVERFMTVETLMTDGDMLLLDVLVRGTFGGPPPGVENIYDFEATLHSARDWTMVFPIENGFVIGFHMEDMTLPPPDTCPNLEDLPSLLEDKFLIEAPFRPPGLGSFPATFPERLRTAPWEPWDLWDPLNSPFP